MVSKLEKISNWSYGFSKDTEKILYTNIDNSNNTSTYYYFIFVSITWNDNIIGWYDGIIWILFNVFQYDIDLLYTYIGFYVCI